MTRGVDICGSDWLLGRPLGGRLEDAVHRVVNMALERSGVPLAGIDMVLTVASDTLDGAMIPVKAEIAGTYGREHMNIPSSAGHAVTAAAAMIESGQAETVLIVGWGSATRMSTQDFRRNQADPFYCRPIIATPAMAAALQASELEANWDIQEEAARAAWRHLWGEEPAADPAGPPIWARTGFCDGAVALVLRQSRGEGVILADHGSASRGYEPSDERLDPAIWVDEAVSRMSDLRDAATPGFVEVSGPTRASEARAASALTGAAIAPGGGALANFGPATALRLLAVGRSRVAQTGRSGLVVDLAGPVGQHVTVLSLVPGCPP